MKWDKHDASPTARIITRKKGISDLRFLVLHSSTDPWCCHGCLCRQVPESKDLFNSVWNLCSFNGCMFQHQSHLCRCSQCCIAMSIGTVCCWSSGSPVVCSYAKSCWQNPLIWTGRHGMGWAMISRAWSIAAVDETSYCIYFIQKKHQAPGTCASFCMQPDGSPAMPAPILQPYDWDCKILMISACSFPFCSISFLQVRTSSWTSPHSSWMPYFSRSPSWRGVSVQLLKVYGFWMILIFWDYPKESLPYSLSSWDIGWHIPHGCSNPPTCDGRDDRITWCRNTCLLSWPQQSYMPLFNCVPNPFRPASGAGDYLQKIFSSHWIQAESLHQILRELQLL